MVAKLKKGLVQVYTGDGKGKTTAAIGQGIRAVGRGLKVCMIQFLKGSPTGELVAIKRLNPDFQILRFEKKRGFFWTLNEDEKKELKKEVESAFQYAKDIMSKGNYDMLILDEIMGVLQNELLKKDDVCQFIKEKPDHIELILTGRNAPVEIIEVADLVTEMKEIKHYFRAGITARKGIEN